MPMRMLFCHALVIISFPCLAQSTWDQRINITFDSEPIIDVLTRLARESSINLAYSPKFFDPEKKVTANFQNDLITDVLQKVLAETGVEYEIKGGRILLKKKKIMDTHRVFGYVRDQARGDGLAFATIYFPDLNQGTSTNEMGYYSLRVPSGKHRMITRYVGREESLEMVQVAADQEKHFYLSSKPSEVEVIITPDLVQGAIVMNQTYRRKALTDLARNAPAVSGESDVLQTVRSLPGVQSNAGEVGGYFVRGGNSDQNLILMDGVPLYYPSHLLGIYSVFTSEAVNSIQVFKSGFPARYGGRLSSVMDILTRNGNQNHWEGEASVSLQSLRLAVQGPISQHGSIMVGGRHSISAPFVNQVLSESFFRVPESFVESRYHDIHFKVNHRIGKRDKLLFNLYSGRDAIELEDAEFSEVIELSSRNSWSNTIAGLHYHRTLGKGSFLQISQSYNHFASEFLQLQEFDDFFDEELGTFLFRAAVSDNVDIESKASLDVYFSTALSAKVGTGFIRHQFTPSLEAQEDDGVTVLDSQGIDFNFFTITKEGTFEAVSRYLFTEFDLQWSKKLFSNIGMRLSQFENGEDRYLHFEPRLHLQYAFTDQLSLQLTTSKMVQYLHQIANADLALPKDIWLPSDDFILPAIAWHHNAAINFRAKNRVTFRVESYLKRMRNLALVFDVADISLNDPSFLENASIGSGQSKGVEGTLEWPFQRGSVTSSLAWSKTNRNFKGINRNQNYPFQFDRRLEWKSLITYAFSPRFTVGSRLYVGSAHPEFLVRDGSIFFDLNPLDLSLGQDKNGLRGEPQVRWDLSASYRLSERTLKHHFKLNLYNVLNAQNSSFAYLSHGASRLTQDDVFAMPFIPSFQYTISF